MAWPIMGTIQEPVDVPGTAVYVQADLNDYYYVFSINDDVPSLYYDINLNSANRTNDSYDPWKKA